MHRLSVLGFVLVVGCGYAAVSRSETPRTFTAGDYHDVYERWTRHADDFAWSRLAEVAHVSATYESYEFRSAYVARYAEDHSLPESSRTTLLQESLSDGNTRHRFFMTFGVPVFREGDFNNERSDWRVALVDPSGNQSEPVEVLQIARPSRDIQTYFPSVSRQRHTYRLAFAQTRADGTATIPENAEYMILRFSSATGQVELRWDFIR